MFLNTKSKVASFREVTFTEFVFFYFQATLEDFLSLGPTDGDMYGNFFIAANGEGSDGVAGFGGNGCLAGELFQDLGGSSQSITRFTDGDVYRSRREERI